jgi:hypothetical protein
VKFANIASEDPIQREKCVARAEVATMAPPEDFSISALQSGGDGQIVEPVGQLLSRHDDGGGLSSMRRQVWAPLVALFLVARPMLLGSSRGVCDERRDARQQ